MNVLTLIDLPSQTELTKLVVDNLVPLIITAFVSVLGSFFGFIVFEFLNKKRIALLLIAFLVGFYIVPNGAGWILFGTFFVMVLYTLFRSIVGPTKGNHIYFAGFYDNSGEKGYLSRNGTVRFLDSQFFKRFHELVGKSKTNELTGLDAINLRVPSLVFSWCDFERFRNLANRYAGRGVGVVWGTTDKDGNLQHLECRLNTQIYFGGDTAQNLIDAPVQVLKNSNVKTEEKAEFLAQVLAAFWINSFSNSVSESHGWKAALDVSKQARLQVEKALVTLEKKSGTDASKIIEFAQRMILPNFLVEEARTRLHADQYEEAIDQLVNTLVLNPLWPFDSNQEFSDYYTAQHHALVTAGAPLKDEVIVAELESLEAKITPLSPPHLQLLLNWFNGCGKKLKDIEAKIDKAFSTLAETHPNNPFVYIYWSDAIRVPPRLGLGKKGKLAASIQGDGLPIHSMENAVSLLEKAYSIAPDMNLIASRLAGIYFMLALTHDERSLEHKKWMKKFHECGEKAAVHITDMSEAWKGKDAVKMEKYGLKYSEEERKLSLANPNDSNENNK